MDATDIALGDVDGDGHNELVVTQKDGGTLWYVAKNPIQSMETSNYNFVLVGGSSIDPDASSVEISGLAWDEMKIKPPCTPDLAAGDVDGDCDSDFDDLILISEQWLMGN